MQVMIYISTWLNSLLAQNTCQSKQKHFHSPWHAESTCFLVAFVSLILTLRVSAVLAKSSTQSQHCCSPFNGPAAIQSASQWQTDNEESQQHYIILLLKLFSSSVSKCFLFLDCTTVIQQGYIQLLQYCHARAVRVDNTLLTHGAVKVKLHCLHTQNILQIGIVQSKLWDVIGCICSGSEQFGKHTVL